jgi:hypothetical protein
VSADYYIDPRTGERATQLDGWSDVTVGEADARQTLEAWRHARFGDSRLWSVADAVDVALEIVRRYGPPTNITPWTCGAIEMTYRGIPWRRFARPPGAKEDIEEMIKAAQRASREEFAARAEAKP